MGPVYRSGDVQTPSPGMTSHSGRPPGASYVYITAKILLDACWTIFRPQPDWSTLNQRSEKSKAGTLLAGGGGSAVPERLPMYAAISAISEVLRTVRRKTMAGTTPPMAALMRPGSLAPNCAPPWGGLPWQGTHQVLNRFAPLARSTACAAAGAKARPRRRETTSQGENFIRDAVGVRL